MGEIAAKAGGGHCGEVRGTGIAVRGVVSFMKVGLSYQWLAMGRMRE